MALLVTNEQHIVNMTDSAILSELSRKDIGSREYSIATQSRSTASESTFSSNTQNTTQSPNTPSTEPTIPLEGRNQENSHPKNRPPQVIQGFSPSAIPLPRITRQTSLQAATGEDIISVAATSPASKLSGSSDYSTLPIPKTCEISDDAILDDDEDSDWEGSVEIYESNSIPADHLMHKRMALEPSRSSQQSLLSLMFARGEQQQQQQHQSRRGYASRWTSTTGDQRIHISDSIKHGSEDKESQTCASRPIGKILRSNAQPILKNGHGDQTADPAATSPRTTRRYMLATELTESLRRDLLWEREVASPTAKAVLKGRHGEWGDDEMNANASNNICEMFANNGYYDRGW